MGTKQMVTATVQFAIDVEYDEKDEWIEEFAKKRDAVLEDIEDIASMDGVTFLGCDVISEDDWSD